LVVGGEIDLVNSLFESNYDAQTSGVGVTNFGGQVHCNIEQCLPVCTVCLDEQETKSPTPHPATPSPTPYHSTTPPTNKQNTTAVVVTISTLIVSVLVGLLALRHKLNATSVTFECRDQNAAVSCELPDTSGTQAPRHVSFVFLQSSRAAIFVVDHNLRLELWSTGNDRLVTHT
jgi:hypothetical protein